MKTFIPIMLVLIIYSKYAQNTVEENKKLPTGKIGGYTSLSLEALTISKMHHITFACLNIFPGGGGGILGPTPCAVTHLFIYCPVFSYRPPGKPGRPMFTLGLHYKRSRI